jgi:hypothetical protein
MDNACIKVSAAVHANFSISWHILLLRTYIIIHSFLPDELGRLLNAIASSDRSAHHDHKSPLQHRTSYSSGTLFTHVTIDCA